MFECIERMSVVWIVKALIEIGLVLLIVSIGVLAILFFLEGNDANERSRKNELSAMQIQQKIEGDKHPDNPG